VEVSDGGVLVAKFRYDGEGRRILKMFDTDSPGSPDGLDTYEHIFLSGQQVIETREGSGATPAQAETLQPKYQNIWSPRYIDSLILRDENTDGDGLCDDSRVYYLADANFNVTALVDTNGDVVERYLYSPYGEVTILDPDFSADADNVSDYANTTLYTGRTLDTPTGLMYYRARYYHAQLGRFVGRDPIGYCLNP
jgi:RHS repeat-associated protein